MNLRRFGYVVALVLAQCFTLTPVQAAAPAGAEEDPGFPKPAADADRYKLGPGDVITVFVWNNSELSTTVPVLPDGTVSTPLVDGVMASGKTPVQLAREVEAALSEYVKSPRVTVQVATAKSTFNQVKVTGEFAHQTSLPYQDGMTVMDAVLAAGGLGTYANGKKARIIRGAGDKQQEIPVDINKAMKGDPKQNLPLQPGDILNVKKTIL